MSQVLVIGATSGIAEAAARIYAERGDSLFLVGRDTQRLDAIADDLRVRGAAQVDVLRADMTEHDRHEEIVAAALDALPNLDVALVAHGVLPDQQLCQADVGAALHSIDVNFLSVVSVLTPLANRLAEKESGTIAVISSVAGDRGRQSNYIYGAAKSGLDAFLQGLRNRLTRNNVHVVTIKPGFVTTRMTEDVPGRGGLLWADADKVAGDIVRAIDSGRNVAYVPGFWALIMLVVRSIPEAIFKKLSL